MQHVPPCQGYLGMLRRSRPSLLATGRRTSEGRPHSGFSDFLIAAVDSDVPLASASSCRASMCIFTRSKCRVALAIPTTSARLIECTSGSGPWCSPEGDVNVPIPCAPGRSRSLRDRFGSLSASLPTSARGALVLMTLLKQPILACLASPGALLPPTMAGPGECPGGIVRCIATLPGGSREVASEFNKP